jgi:hypothetical protein
MSQSRPQGERSVPVQSIPSGDPPPYEPVVPPDPDERDRDEDDIPDTPGIEPPPVPIRDPLPSDTPEGPYIA